MNNSIDYLIEENFCLKFELDSLADHILFGQHERWVHGFMNKYGEELHIKRYEFAAKHIQDKTVLDIAGGCGYGTFYLAQNGNPSKITSIDLDANAVRYANHRYPNSKLDRQVGNAEDFSMESPLDVIISFETIEHLPNFEKFLNCVHKALKPGGKFFVSTPVVANTTRENINQFHVIEWSLTDFQKLIAKYFTIDSTYTQNIQLKSAVVDSFWKKIQYKLNADKFNTYNPEIIPLDKDLNENEINAGFQLLVCTRK